MLTLRDGDIDVTYHSLFPGPVPGEVPSTHSNHSVAREGRDLLVFVTNTVTHVFHNHCARRGDYWLRGKQAVCLFRCRLWDIVSSDVVLKTVWGLGICFRSFVEQGT